MTYSHPACCLHVSPCILADPPVFPNVCTFARLPTCNDAFYVTCIIATRLVTRAEICLFWILLRSLLNIILILCFGKMLYFSVITIYIYIYTFTAKYFSTFLPKKLHRFVFFHFRKLFIAARRLQKIARVSSEWVSNWFFFSSLVRVNFSEEISLYFKEANFTKNHWKHHANNV